MREEFFKRNLVKASIFIIFGVIFSICSFIYIAANIYSSLNLTVPVIILFIGLGMQAWGFRRIRLVGKESDKADPDFDEI